MNDSTKIYLLTALLFIFTFLSAKFVISELKALPTNSFLGGFSLVITAGLIISIIKLSKIVNNK